MRIAGMQKLTLLDFPGRTAATVFTPGCNFRCPFCHNAELASAPIGAADGLPGIPADEALALLGKRRGLLDGVCVSGGEPLLQPGLAEFCIRMHQLGMAVKVDTNGTRPDRLQELLDAGCIDAVAMDVKNAPARYAETVGVRELDLDPIRASMRLLLRRNTPFEFRTTVTRELHSLDDLVELAQWIADEAARAEAEGAPSEHSATSVRWFIQNFKDSDTILAGEGTLHSWRNEDLRALLPRLQAILPGAQLRGID